MKPALVPAMQPTARPAMRRLLTTTRRLAERFFRPSPRLSVSAWAAAHFRLSRENAAEPGPFDVSRNPPMAEIMDAMGDPDVEVVAVMCASQQGKSTAILATALRQIHQDPAPMLMMLPTLELARAFALERLAPAVRDCKALRGLVHAPATRDSNSTILARRFVGGALYLVGANSAASLSSRPVRTVVVDEADRAPVTLAGEGNPIDLAWKRAAAFHNRKLILTSSPTVAGASIIEDYFLRGDQRRYHVPCLHCGAFAPLAWRNVRWEKDAEGRHLPETAALVCEACGGMHQDTDRRAMLAAGRWVADQPGRRIRSYHLNALASPFLRLEEIVRDFLDAKRERERLRVWTNTVLAETVAVQEEAPMQDGALAGRLERYPAMVPDGVHAITAGVDVQDNRLAFSLWGYGAGEESWLLHHEEFFGSPGEDAVWAELDGWLLRAYAKADGTTLPVLRCGIDVGGHFTDAAYRFISPRQGRPNGRALAFKGHPNIGAPMLPPRPSTAGRGHVRLWSYGSTTVKDEFLPRLDVPEPGPRYVHLIDTVDREYLQQLLGERPHLEFKQGRRRRVYRKVRERTEALDCACYALLALHTMGLRFVVALGREPVADAAPPPEPDAIPQVVVESRNIGAEAALARARHLVSRGGYHPRATPR